MSLWDNDHINYDALGFRCGIEVHQQLDTDQKLFCRCPVGLVAEAPDTFVLRHMRPTLSEMGEYDGTALMERKKRKEIIYQILNNHVCTYEMDDTHPFLVNEKALDIGIKLALLFQCKIVDEAHVSRKQYLDGSIPTGFQRTILIGTDGWIPYKGKKIGIRQINIEEDACREVSDQGHRIVFRTDRLSTPLVEVITEAHMLNPMEAGEVTCLLAETNRISGLVRRGIGTARQDVNVSIMGGNRVEIKGVEKIGLIPALTHHEALRQKALLELRDELVRRRISDRMYPDTDHPPIRVDEARIQKAKAEVPEFPWERREKLKKMGLSEQLVDELATHPFFKNFQVVAEMSGDPKWAARTIAETLKFLKRKGYDISHLKDEDFFELAKLLRERRFYREGTPEIIKVMCQNGYTAKNAVEKRISKIPFEEIDLLVAELIKNNDTSLDLDKRRRFLMGLVMRKYRGAIPGEFLWHKISQAMFL